jgi:FKBP-type peptidyl-prolyl cis-trans isomerase (trigger factor)
VKIKSALERLPRDTLKLTVTLPWQEVKKVYEKVLKKKAKEMEISGFRKGKAPLSMVKKKLGTDALARETLQEILPIAYAEAVKEHQLKPIIQPKLQVLNMKEGKDWQFEAQTCEKPQVKLGKYKEKVKTALKAPKIIVPGKDEKKQEKTQEEKLKELFEVLLKEVKVKLPEILVENEVNRSLARLLNQIEKLGITLESYLNSVKKTVDQLRGEYKERAERTLKLEFVLETIADDLRVKVEKKEIDKIIAKTNKENKGAPVNQYYLASLLRRQKTLDRLLNL